MAVNGYLYREDISAVLSHEHILVDFIGAKETGNHRWNREEVVQVLLPHLEKLNSYGCNTFFDCTPAFIGRDPLLLKAISDRTGMQIITNTGLYGAGNNKYIPDYAFRETEDQLAERWILEWEVGIEDTGIRPGFIKIGIDEGPLSEMHRKLVKAAAITHLATGLTIAGHTGTAIGAFEEFDILEEAGVRPNAFIWIHAQNEKNHARHVEAAQRGAWVSFDGITSENIEDYILLLSNMKSHSLLDKVLISHDAGWYSPGETHGGDFIGYTALFEQLIPALKDFGFSEQEIKLLTKSNPIAAFNITVRGKG